MCKAVGREELIEAHLLAFDPVAHHHEAVEQPDLGVTRGRRNDVDGAIDIGLGQDLRRILRIDQNHLGAARLQALDALADHFARRLVIAQHRIAADLPQHEVRRLLDHVGIEARDHLLSLFAADALVQHR
jgi:hypothetical protein